MKQLPNKPSELILLAVKDLGRAEKSKLHQIDMNYWHKPDNFQPITPENRCSVCFAGSIMAFSLNTNPSKYIHSLELSYKFGIKNAKKFQFLNCVRQGNIGVGLANLGIKLPEDIGESRIIVHYTDNPKIFKTQMRRLARDLANKGL
jgi:hypothetical protein